MNIYPTILFTIATILAMPAQLAVAYEIDTHARITQEAYKRSILHTAPTTLSTLGLTFSRRLYSLQSRSPIEVSLGNRYFDLSTNPPTPRDGKRYDYVYGRDRVPNRWTPVVDVDGITAPFIADWLSRGSVREDDSNVALALKARWNDPNALDQLDNQYNNGQQNINRFCNHFYDPIKHRGLALAGVVATLGCGLSSTDALQWGLGSTQTGGLGSADPARLNRFTILDAREAQWRALTGLDANFAPRPEAQTRVGRDAYWATTFRALGDVLHLVQDMGQPQHTRNAAHPFGDAARLEDRTNKRALGIPITKFFASGSGTVATEAVLPIDYGNYPVPQFARFRHFFSTTEGVPTYGGLGLANYSNEGFFTANANFGSSTYARPESVKALYNEVALNSPDVGGSTETYLLRRVPDNYGGVPSDEIKMTRESVLKEMIEQYDSSRTAYSIDDAVVDDQVKLLIPRAVAYSAGILDHFFRGSLTIAPTIDGVFGVMDHASGTSFTKLVLNVKNTTAAANDPVSNAAVPQQMTLGKFVAVVRFHRDLVFNNNLSTAIGLGDCVNLAAIYGAGNESNAAGHDPNVTTACREGPETLVTSAPLVQSLDAGEEKELSFDFSASPIPLAGVDYSVQVVYRGKLGYEDDAVVTGFREMADPMFITRHNMYDYIMHGASDSLNNNEFGAAIPSSEFPGPVNFYRANRHVSDWGYASDLKGLNISGWSFFGMEAFTAYDYTRATRYTYTFGPRTSAAVATASAVPTGGFTRIAVLMPLWTPGTAVETPPVRIERQRLAESAYMGETVNLLNPQRHRSRQVAWFAPMRGVNSWHSDGYVWYRPELTPAFSANVNFWQYCRVGPRTELQGASRDYDLLAVDANGQHLVFEIGLRLTNAGDVYWRQNGPPPNYTVDTQDRGQICTASNRSRLIPPPGPSETGALGVAFRYSTGFWSTSYSPWDVLISTNSVSPFENASVPNDYLYPNAVEMPFATSAQLNMDGIAQTVIAGRAPTPVSIALKYR